jgi:methyl-accepting chemotaxis protein
LEASIRDIGDQVSQSTTIVGRAVQAGEETRTTIEALNERVNRIGAVVEIISEVAARTNLLALNVTIEAARAGDAGKGFAVVASEVKQLAAQTAGSTKEITSHISEVNTATQASVAAVGRIEQTIGEVNVISGSIAASGVAVHRQDRSRTCRRRGHGSAADPRCARTIAAHCARAGWISPCRSPCEVRTVVTCMLYSIWTRRGQPHCVRRLRE